MRFPSSRSCTPLKPQWHSHSQSSAAAAAKIHLHKNNLAGAPTCKTPILPQIFSTLSSNGRSQTLINLYQRWRRLKHGRKLTNFMALLRICARTETLWLGEVVHADILKTHLKSHVLIANALIDMYSRCGQIDSARTVFASLTKRDIVSWNSMMAAYLRSGFSREALALFKQMQVQGFKPDRVSYLASIKACGSLGALQEGKRIHARLMELGWISDAFLGSALIDMYAKCGNANEAYQVFENLPHQDVVSWTALISGFAQQGRGEEALRLFQRMLKEGVKPNKTTFLCVLKACAYTGALDQGKEMHKMLRENGVALDLSVGSSLVHMYFKCGSMHEALQVFLKLPRRDVVAWTALISGLIDNVQNSAALEWFDRMQDEGVVPNRVTYLCALKACGSLMALEKGQIIHSKLLLNGLIKDTSVANTLLSMYTKCNSIEKASRVFSEIKSHDLVSWNIMIDAYAEHHNGLQALQLFETMQKQGFRPDEVTFVSTLKACRSIGALDKGRHIHAMIISHGLEISGSLGNILVDMYCKCGGLDDACEVFWKLPKRDAFSWNTILDGYAHQGQSREAIHLFEKMKSENVKPDKVTFVCLLKACCHAGLLDEACNIFESMQSNHGVAPEMEHYTCMVDLHGRSGNLQKAVHFINNMPTQPDAAVWMSLLGACQLHGNLKLGRDAFDSVLKLQPRNVAAYTIMSNIYAAANMWSHEVGLRKAMTCS